MDETALYKEIGRRLAARRRRLNQTQTAVAAQAGVSRASLANIELGRQAVLPHQLYRLADALSLDGLSSLLPTPKEIAGGAPERLRLSDDTLPPQQRQEVEAFFASVSPKTAARGS